MPEPDTRLFVNAESAERLPLWPPPRVPLAHVLPWLANLRWGAQLTAGALAATAALTVLAWVGLFPAGGPGQLAPWAMQLPRLAGLWLLLSAEPGRADRYAALRRFGRGGAVVFAVLLVGLPVLWTLSPAQRPTAGQKEIAEGLLWVLSGALWAVQFAFAGALAERVGDKLARSLFTLLAGAAALLTALLVLGMVLRLAGFGAPEAAPATRPAATPSDPAAYFWARHALMATVTGMYAAIAALFARLGRRLQSAADELRELH